MEEMVFVMMMMMIANAISPSNLRQTSLPTSRAW